MSKAYRQLMADEARAFAGNLPAAFVPRADTPVILAEGPCAWLDQHTERQHQAVTKSLAEVFRGALALAPPIYDSFWVEGLVLHTEGSGEVRLGTNVTTLRRADGTWRCDTWGWTQVEGQTPCPSNVGISYDVEADGTVNANHGQRDIERDARPDFEGASWRTLGAPWTPKSFLERWDYTGASEMDAATVATSIFHAGMAIVTCAFAVCRNVVVEDAAQSPPVARKRARRLGLTEPATTVSRIVLPGGASRSTGARLGAVMGPQALPAHMVRAHPKTYRRRDDGTGGLGRYKAEGTWMWAPQARGSKANGERVPNVTVQVPKDHTETENE